tara:strand:+ start:20 stop:574 length:555 start_codon:yes stop_codon:yes gene_type:complete
MSDNKVWDYRVVRSNKEDGTSADWYSIQEIYYDDETGEPTAQTVDLQVEGEDKAELRQQLVDMVVALDKDVVDEIKSEVNNIDINTHKGTDFTPPETLGSDGHGSTIFESPDGGNTIYRRMMGEAERTIVPSTVSSDLPEQYQSNTVPGFKPEEDTNLNQRVLNLEIENSDLKDMLREKGVDIV